MNEEFLKDVDKGLSASPKFLSSRYFYDAVGDDLFVQIMNMPEYYLTKAEHEIFKYQLERIVASLGVKKGVYFELLELGAGDGFKTKELLRHLLNEGYDFSYSPVDISQNALEQLEKSLIIEFPTLDVKTKQGDYFGVLNSIKESFYAKVVLFLGSNLGNLLDAEASDFLQKLSKNLNSGDKLFLGLDLIKHEDIVLPAYNDSNGITAQFNLNLLNRINKEFGAGFLLKNWRHDPEYTQQEGIARSFLTCVKDQAVYVEALDKTFKFKEGERIHTEISRKYDDAVLKEILAATNLEIIAKMTDSKEYFADYTLTMR